MITRQLFNINGNGGDTGPVVSGFLHQLRWNPTSADTGAILVISVQPRTGDTGDGYNVFALSGVTTKGGSNFVEHPRNNAIYLLADNSGDSGFEKYALCGDRLRVKVSNDTGVATPNFAGRLYAYFSDA